jgi:ABC-type Fe3+-hydroxamate transport system substrate-binding protein
MTQQNKEAQKYIKFLDDILKELEETGDKITETRKSILVKKVNKYKNILKKLDVTGKLNK